MKAKNEDVTPLFRAFEDALSFDVRSGRNMLDENKTIDWLGLDSRTGVIVLTLIDEHDWENQRQHVELLQSKLNTYIRAIESGEVYSLLKENLGETVEIGRPAAIKVIARFEPPETAKPFIQYVADALKDAGIGFDYKVLVNHEDRD
jgi:hypothetical protein